MNSIHHSSYGFYDCRDSPSQYVMFAVAFATEINRISSFETQSEKVHQGLNSGF